MAEERISEEIRLTEKAGEPAKDGQEKKNPVQSAERIFQVMETLAVTGPIGLVELSKRLDLHKSCLLYTSSLLSILSLWRLYTKFVNFACIFFNFLQMF